MPWIDQKELQYIESDLGSASPTFYLNQTNRIKILLRRLSYLQPGILALKRFIWGFYSWFQGDTMVCYTDIRQVSMNHLYNRFDTLDQIMIIWLRFILGNKCFRIFGFNNWIHCCWNGSGIYEGCSGFQSSWKWSISKFAFYY